MSKAEAADVPYFISVRGCINCDVSKTHKERFGTDYGFDHELVAICLLRGCYDYGYSITNPFFDPAEIVRKARELNLPVATHNGIKYCQGIKERFGEFYQEIGVLVDSFIGQMAAEK
ncbi:MAG: hypothetical protein J4469_03570 [Candidatus Aenigmarchaeota archaeon]|nr:hypothetical protein [Candidatus Aenigmarchaeota archaeon]